MTGRLCGWELTLPGGEPTGYLCRMPATPVHVHHVSRDDRELTTRPETPKDAT